MANKPTEYSVQELKNLSADVSVSPPIPREGIMGKSSGGSWYNIAVHTDGSLIGNIDSDHLIAQEDFLN